MASKNLPTDLTGGESGHPGLHNDIHEVVNEFDYDGLVAAPDGKVIKKSGGLWVAGDDLNSGASGFTDIGWRYVDYVNGLDTNNGLSPSTAMKTIQAAHDDLPGSGIPRGGTIWLAAGQHIVNNTTISKDGTRVIGAGVWTTELLMDQTGYTNDGLRWDDAQNSYAADFQLTDRSNRATPIGEGRRGIWIEGSQESVFERIFINGWGNNFAGTHDFDNAPCAIYVSGVNVFGDWVTLRNIRNRNSWAGLRITSGSNGWVERCVFGGEKESVWILRRTGLGGDAVSWRFQECQWLGGGGGAGEFSVRCETSTANHAGRIRFDNCQLEISTATGDTNGYYSELTDTIWMGGHLGVVNMSAGKKAIHIGSGASDSVIGPYTQDGLTPADDFQDDHGVTWWQPSDYTGTY